MAFKGTCYLTKKSSPDEENLTKNIYIFEWPVKPKVRNYETDCRTNEICIFQNIKVPTEKGLARAKRRTWLPVLPVFVKPWMCLNHVVGGLGRGGASILWNLRKSRGRDKSCVNSFQLSSYNLTSAAEIQQIQSVNQNINRFQFALLTYNILLYFTANYCTLFYFTVL